MKVVLAASVSPATLQLPATVQLERLTDPAEEIVELAVKSDH